MGGVVRSGQKPQGQRRPVEGCDAGTWEWTEDPALRSAPGWVRYRCGAPSRRVEPLGELQTLNLCPEHAGRLVRL